MNGFNEKPLPKENADINNTVDLETCTNEVLLEHVDSFLGEKIEQLPQEEVEIGLLPILTELSKRNLSGFSIFSHVLPGSVSAESLNAGDSSWAKVYWALFSFSRTEEYKKSPELQDMVRDLENIIDQNPQMLGPVAMWQIAKDIMWRKDVPSHAKGSLVGSMTYALAFFNDDQYESELLKNLDFEDKEKYSEVAHMLEAIKQFWTLGHESFALDRGVPDFYLQALRKIQETPEANFLLSIRAREIVSMLEESEDFPNEARDVRPFELSSNLYASTQINESLFVIPPDDNHKVEEAIRKFDENEKEINPPQWMIDEAIANGESWITWQPPHELMRARQRLFDDMHKYAAIPIDAYLGELTNTDTEKTQELLFDYEYLVSRPVREIIQREFGFELKDLSIREQFYFLNFLKEVTVHEANLVKNFTNYYGTTGIKTFLALEQEGPDFGWGIVGSASVAAQFGFTEIVKKIFSKYTELNDQAYKVEEYLRENFSTEDQELVHQVMATIRKRASGVYRSLLERDITTPEAQTRIEVIMQKANRDSLLFTSAFKTLKLRNELDLETIKDTSFESVPSSRLDQTDIDTMLSILERNWQGEPEEFIGEIKQSLVAATKNEHSTFYVLRHNGKIVGFNRFDDYTNDREKPRLYFGSFNTDPEFGNGKLGEAIYEESLKRELGKEAIIEADCDPFSPITKKYLESGFVATNFILYGHKPSLHIVHDRELQQAAGETTVRKIRIGDRFTELSGDVVLTRLYEEDRELYGEFKKISPALKQKVTPLHQS